LCIEIDGVYWHKNKKEKDEKKDKYLLENGYRILRISEVEANNIKIIRAKIKNNIVNCWKLLEKDNQQPS
jgi:very-short-patch-repair endonuclease